MSSRPIIEPMEALASFPGLRLQDLTRDAIRTHVEDHLKDRLAKRSLEMSMVLADEVAEKSSGVFLWVVLVVQSLVQGLRNGDRISELQVRLNELPQDLEDLFRHMLGKIPARYHRQASELLQTILQRHELQSYFERRILALEVSYDLEGEQYALDAPFRPAGLVEQIDRLDELDRWLKSRSCGLLEFDKDPILSQITSSRKVLEICVTFVHRTVAEFFAGTPVEAIIPHNPKGGNFCASRSLFFANLLMAKSLPPSKLLARFDEGGRLIREAITGGLIFASRSEQLQPISAEAFHQFDTTVSKHWTAAEEFSYGKTGVGIHLKISKQGEHWARLILLPFIPERDTLSQIDSSGFMSIAASLSLR
jgi:hypothetical protein